jgi:O-antigen ligase
VKFQDGQKIVAQTLPLSLLLLTLVVTPGVSVDPINPPKLLILSILAGAYTGLLLLNRNLIALSYIKNKFLFFTVGLFILGLFVSFAASRINWKEQLFGAYGRNTGLLTYISLAFILIALVLFFTSDLLSNSIMVLTVGGVASSLYGFLQYLGLDPVSWGNLYNPIIGFLGNPNFQSSFIGISSVVLFHLMFHPNQKNSHKALYFAGFMFNLFVIYQSDSQQGFLILALGISIILLALLFPLKSKIYFWGVSFVLSIGATLSIFGFLQKGPFGTILYQPSVTFRGDYWRAGVKMFQENTLTGLGLDSYGSYYRQYRDFDAVTRRGPEITSDAAHNVFIDLFANGGLILGIPYVLLVFFTLRIFVRALKIESKNRSVLILVFALWTCYQAQSIISINQIALATWGWVLMGLTIGQSLQILSEGDAKSLTSAKNKPKSGSREVGAGTIVTTFLCAVFGFAIGVLPLSGSASERAAIQSGKVEKVLQSAFQNPRDPGRMNNLAAILGNYGHPDEALKIAKRTTYEFPTSFVAWRIVTQIGNASLQDKLEALERMRELDPLNPDLK